MEEKKNQIVNLVDKLLDKESFEKRQGVTDLTHLAGDGSQRIFYRLQLSNATTMVGVLPNADSPLGLKEAVSAWQICCHLHRRGIAVPEPLAFDEKSGLILFEDLGDQRLHDLMGHADYLRDDRRSIIYKEVIRELVRMQVEGRGEFDTSWCWQTSHMIVSSCLKENRPIFCRHCVRIFSTLTQMLIPLMMSLSGLQIVLRRHLLIIFFTGIFKAAI